MAKDSPAKMMMHRAEALAYVALTRISTAVPIRTDVEELDYLVSVQREVRKDQFRIFGVIVKATTELDSVKAANAYGRKIDADRSLTRKRYFFPTIVLLYSMSDETGYFAWVSQPDKEGWSVKLIQNKTLEFAEFDIVRLMEVVETVNFWYDEADSTMR